MRNLIKFIAKSRKQISLLLGIGLLIGFSVVGAANQPVSSDQYITLNIIKKMITVDGKQATVYQIQQPNGTLGYEGVLGQRFNVIVVNKTSEPTILHWHGLIVPNNQDGVPYLTQKPIMPGQSFTYSFPLRQSGTYWMHGHFQLQEQQLLAAPLIIQSPADSKQGYQDVVMMLEDFTFKNPAAILANLKCESVLSGSSSLTNTVMPMAMSSHHRDLNDVKYDAFLTNGQTLQQPDVIKVQAGKTVRLRIINGSASSNFFINLGTLTGQAVAVDGHDIVPISKKQFQLSMGQRLDILVAIPSQGGAYPILAQGEGTTMQTGLILATNQATIPQLSETTNTMAGAFNYSDELQYRAIHPLPNKPVIRVLAVDLEGNMQNYLWTINYKAWPYYQPLIVKKGERVELVFTNSTDMEHPMHLHGHVFEVTEINGKEIRGAFRDTVDVMPHSTVKVQFDANNPGVWLLHCHNLYHAAAGMATVLEYSGYQAPTYTKAEKASISTPLWKAWFDNPTNPYAACQAAAKQLSQ
ncbi:MAG: hypothetical protein A3E87_07340 [Gammaproteobacteria bacterium RIFCSPHIGHO2_12_FULL_35_23]|nr:MAG: hypothetical protein A3E87_07340 [Gammaproteobacteria bacterium RIFCSPHIGHO2_12_FULL_35_23]